MYTGTTDIETHHMLLRRVTKDVRDQNWTAIAIDFLIVVTGVFIGIQVANWNEERLNRQDERVLIARLRTDFDRIGENAERSLVYHEKMAANLRTLIRSVRSDRLKDNDVAAFDQALILGITIQTSADHSGTFTEIMSSGRANVLRDRDLLDALVDYEDFLKRFDFAIHWYMDLIMSAVPAYTSAFGYDSEFQLRQALFDNKTEASLHVKYDFNALTADPTFENAAEQLLFVHIGMVLWRQRISERVDAIQIELSDALSVD